MQDDVIPLAGNEHAPLAGPLVFRNWNTSTEVISTDPPITSPAESSDSFDRALSTAKEQGRREAEAQLLQEMERRAGIERAQVASALEGFVSEKRRYFANLEKEVVRLALAIAERVLHRETSMDPALLAGAARVALEQVDQESTAVLLVAPGDGKVWKEVLAAIGRDVEIREDALLQRGECRLQTDAGSFELGVRSQLCEIERGFFELLGRSPSLVV